MAVKLKFEDVARVLREEHGLIGPSAMRLGTNRASLKLYIGNHAKAAAVLYEARDGLVDKAEGKLWDLVEQGEWRAIQMVLLTLGKDRGYAMPKGTPVALENNTVVVDTINIVSIPAGQFVMGDGRLVSEQDVA